jgi:hypothetical protein
VVSPTSLPLYPHQEQPQYQVYRRLGWPQSRSLLPQFLGRLACSLVATLTDLSCVPVVTGISRACEAIIAPDMMRSVPHECTITEPFVCQGHVAVQHAVSLASHCAAKRISLNDTCYVLYRHGILIEINCVIVKAKQGVAVGIE